MNRYKLIKADSNARCGEFTTKSGSFETPNFMPVATRGSVKGVDTDRLKECGAQIMLVNTYHLWLRPSSETINRVGGIHRFTDWDGPILSDSGGFQVYSLKDIRSLSDEGVEFRSHLDGSKYFLTPEKSIQIQEELGVDIAMVLDECPAGDMPLEQLSKSLDMTLRWAKRSLEARRNPQTAIFGITQGGGNRELRTKAAATLSELDFDGMAIGGLSVGESKEIMYDVLSYHVNQLPQHKIRYLMGVGTTEDIVEGVRNGVDLFDCVMPTRAGRFGRAYVNGEKPYINMRNSVHKLDPNPVDSTCNCLCCRKYSRAYLHHLFHVGEMLGPQLLSIHNLTHYLSLMKRIREAIQEQRFEDLYNAEKNRWQGVSNR